MMDERTRTTDEQTAPKLRRTLPTAPVVKSKPRRGKLIVGLIVLIGLAAGGYWAYRSQYATQPASTAQRTVPQGAPQSVGAATVGQGDIRVIVNGLGTVTPIATVTVQTQINGQLLEVGFTEGQLVKKGDFLAQIDPRPYQLLQAQYEGQLAHDQGVLAQSQVDLVRYQKLAEQNSIARQQYEDQVYIVQQNQGTVKLDQAQIDQQKLNVIYCRIVSPVTGRIGLRLVDPGNYIQTTVTTGIAVVTQMQPITVIFPIPEDDLPDILPQLNAGTPLEVFAYDRANVKMLATGRVMALDSQIDTTTGTVKVRAQFDNADNALFPEPIRQRAASGEDPAQCRHGADGGDPARGAWDLRLRRQCRQHGIGAADQDRPDRRADSGRRIRSVGRRPRGGRRHRPPARWRTRDYSGRAQRDTRGGRKSRVQRAAARRCATTRPAAESIP